jgi:O-6-methylguanine DNA methyltransferase
MTDAILVPQHQALLATTVAHTQLATPFGAIQLFGTTRGLLKLALPNETRAAAESYVRRVLGPVILREDTEPLSAALEQLKAYFAGAGSTFTITLDPHGTVFQRQVWDAVAGVAYGATRSYAQIAQAIGRPAAVRAVGAANGANPLPIIIPCHRIIGADSRLTGYGGGLAMKRGLLDLERGAVGV